ncbi:hypothetical protein H9P43_010111 [Blastocladiella emersonii ATCC 22665]|nr:hypothetical protein H9P43_010111 [Blastocladiella emersonii ATCC 22665]
MKAANPANVVYYITNYVSKVPPSLYNTYALLEHARKLRQRELNLGEPLPLPLPVGSVLRGLVNPSTTSRETSGQQLALDLIRNDDEIDDEEQQITFSNRPITDKVTIADRYMHRPSELESLYDFIWCCRVEPIKSATDRSQQSVPDDDANDGRGVPVPLFNKQASQSSHIGSTKSRAMISMILFKPFRAITEVAPARGETWSQTLDLFKNKPEQGSDRLRWTNNFRDYVNTSPGKLIADSEADNSVTPKQIMPVGIAQEAHGNDAFLHEILSIISQNDQHAAMLLMSAVHYGLLSNLNAPVPALPLELRQQLLKVDSDPAWFAQLANYADLARKTDDDAPVRVQLARQEQLAPYLQGLNIEQRRVVEHVESTLNAIKRGDADIEQLLMLVHGEAGTGKSHVINSIRDMFVAKGSTAAPIGGSTNHAMCGIGTVVSATKPTIDKAKAELEGSFRSVKFVLIDEISWSPRHRPFGGLHVLACGDCFKSEPVMACSLTAPSEQLVERAPEPEGDAAYDGESMQVDGEPQQQQKKRASKRKERPAVSRIRTDANIGRDQWLAFDSVFFLVQQMRQSGDAGFLDVLQCATATSCSA